MRLSGRVIESKTKYQTKFTVKSVFFLFIQKFRNYQKVHLFNLEELYETDTKL